MTALDLWRGLRVIWLHRPRGGYGYAIRVPCTVQSWTTSHATVEVERADGSRSPRVVSRANLREVSLLHEHGVRMQGALDARKES